MRRTSVLLPVLGAWAIVAGCAPAPESSALTSSGPTPHAASVTLPASITGVVAVNGSSSVAAGLSDGRVAIWKTGSDPILLTPHTTRVRTVGSTKDGTAIWSLAEDGSLVSAA